MLPSLFEELQGKMLGAWDADSSNSHGQVLLKLLTNISPIMTLSTFFARYFGCKSPLSNFYKHDFWFRGKHFDGIHRAFQYHQAILLKKHKVAKSIMNAALAYHTAKQTLSMMQHKRALDIDIVIKLMHELLWEKYKQVNEFS